MSAFCNHLAILTQYCDLLGNFGRGRDFTNFHGTEIDDEYEQFLIYPNTPLLATARMKIGRLHIYEPKSLEIHVMNDPKVRQIDRSCVWKDLSMSVSI